MKQKIPKPWANDEQKHFVDTCYSSQIKIVCSFHVTQSFECAHGTEDLQYNQIPGLEKTGLRGQLIYNTNRLHMCGGILRPKQLPVRWLPTQNFMIKFDICFHEVSSDKTSTASRVVKHYWFKFICI